MFAIRQVFERCRKYGILLNPKKTIFVVTKGKLLGFIFSKFGMIIDPERTDVIAKIGVPSSKKAMQYFLDKINFVKRFVPNFGHIVRSLQDLIKKDVQFRWYETQKNAFINIRKAITDSHALMSPYFEKDVILYTFETDFSYAAVLTQKQPHDVEIPILFMRSMFKEAKLNYSQIDKQAYTIYKSIKHFRPYLLKCKTKVIVPYATIRNILIHKEIGDKRAHWMTTL